MEQHIASPVQNSSSVARLLSLDATRLLAVGGIAGPIIFTLLIIAGAANYDGYSHISQKISELGGITAEYPWIQNLNFFLLAFLTVAFSIAVHRSIDDGRGSIVGPALIAVFGVSAAGLNGIFPCDASCEGLTAAGKLHLATGITGFLSMIVGLFVLWRRMNRSNAWRMHARYTLVSAILALTGLVAFVAVDSDLESTVAGLAQRLFVAPVLAWMLITGIKILKSPNPRSVR